MISEFIDKRQSITFIANASEQAVKRAYVIFSILSTFAGYYPKKCVK